jgi:4-hydroxyacetophenone monooxygenase
MPFFQAWLRFSLFWGWGDSLHQYLKVDPDWPFPERSLNSRHDRIRESLTEYVRAELRDRDDLFERVLPDYPPFGKRMLLDNQWYETLRRPNVRLETDSIARVTPRGVVTEDGKLHELDVIILATGFSATEILGTLAVRGTNNRLLSEKWKTDDARAYLGITMPEFPNFFCLYGPNTGLAHGGSIIFHTECQVRYVMRSLVWMIEHDVDAIECREDVHDAYNERVDAALADMVWSHPSVNNWYQNRDGRVVALSPWRLIDYWGMTREPEMSDYLIDRSEADVS